jgi:hypothetical protein
MQARTMVMRQGNARRQIGNDASLIDSDPEQRSVVNSFFYYCRSDQEEVLSLDSRRKCSKTDRIENEDELDRYEHDSEDRHNR